MAASPTLEVDIEIPEALLWLFDDASYKVAYGGRGGAKSESIARALIVLALESPLLILCAREVQNSIADSSKATVEAMISEYDLWGYFERTLTEITCINGSRFIFKGLRSVSVANIKSLFGVDLCWVEEANAVSQRSLDLLLPTIRKEGSQIWFSYNPEEDSDPVHNLFVMGEPPPRSIVRKVGWEDNPWFPEGLRRQKDWMYRRDPDQAEHVWGGKTRRIAKEQIYNNWTEEPFETPDSDRIVFRFGADWGYSIDPTILVRMWIDPDCDRRLYIDGEAWQIGCEIDRLHALFDTVPESHSYPIRADSAKPDTISYLRRRHPTEDIAGYHMKSAKKGPGSLQEGIEFVRSYDILVHPRCIHTIDELKSYKYKVDPHSGEILPVPRDKKNHVMDGLRYALEDVRRPKPGAAAFPVMIGG